MTQGRIGNNCLRDKGKKCENSKNEESEWPHEGVLMKDVQNSHT